MNCILMMLDGLLWLQHMLKNASHSQLMLLTLLLNACGTERHLTMCMSDRNNCYRSQIRSNLNNTDHCI